MENVENLAIRFVGYNLLGSVFADIERGLGEVTAAGDSSSSRLAASFGSIGSSFMSIGVAVAAVLALLGAGLLAVTYHAAEFQSQLVQIHVQARETTGAMLDLGQSFLNSSPQFSAVAQAVKGSKDELVVLGDALLILAPKYGFTATEAAKALYMIQSVTVGSQAETDGMNILASAMMGAAVGHADLQTTASALASIMAAFPQYVGNSAAAMGILDVIVGVGKMRMDDLLGALKTGIIPTLQIAGVSLQDFGGALATMTDLGNPAIQSATALRMALYLIDAPTRKSTDTLAAFGLTEADAVKVSATFDGQLHTLGLTHSQLADDLRKPNGIIFAMEDLHTKMEAAGLSATDQAQVIFDAFGGGKMGKAMVTLYENMDRLKTKTDEIGAGATKLAGNFDYLVQHDPSFMFQMLKSDFDALIDALGRALFPILITLGKHLFDMIDKMKIWVITHNALIQQIVTLVFIIGGAVAAFFIIGGAVAFAISAFIAFITPILGIIGAIAGFVLGVMTAVGWFLELATAIGGIISIITEFAGTVMFGIGMVVALFSGDAIAAVVGLAGAFLPFLVIAALVGVAIAIVVTHFKQIASWLEAVSGRFIPAVITAFKLWKAGLDPVYILTEFLGAMGMKWDTVNAIMQIGKKIWDDAGALIRWVTGIIGSLITSLSKNKDMMDSLNKAWDALQVILPVVGKVLFGIGAVIVGLLAGVFKGLVSMLAEVIPGAVMIFSGAFQVIAGIILVVKAFFIDFNNIISDIIHGKWGQLKTDAITLWRDLSQGVIDIVNGFATIILGIIHVVIGGILAFIGGFVSGFVDFFVWLYNQLVGHSIIPDMVNAIYNWFITLQSNVLGAINWLVQQALSIFWGLTNGMVYIISQAFYGVMWWVNQINSQAQDVLNGLVGWAGGFGSNLVQGIIGGIQSAWSGLLNTLSGLLYWLPQWVKNILGISSPSLVFAMQIGQPIAQGMALGVLQGAPLLHQAVQQTVNSATNIRIPAGAALPSSSPSMEKGIYMTVLEDIKSILQKIEGMEHDISSFSASRRRA